MGYLSGTHNRKAFDCGTPALNRYLAEQASQDMRRRVASCFVATVAAAGADSSSPAVAGFYTLASASVPLTLLPDDVARKLPRYAAIPTVRMGRLAVDLHFKGQGLGAALLADALARASRSEVAAFALLVDAKDATAKRFYQHHGFIAFESAEQSLFLPLATVPG